MKDLGNLLQWLFQELLRNPILIVFVVGALASLFGRIFKSVKAEADKRLREQRSGRMPSAPEPGAQPPLEAEDIAREIRRMMQLGQEDRAEPAERKRKIEGERARSRRNEVRIAEQQLAESAARNAGAAFTPALPAALAVAVQDGVGSMARAAAARTYTKAFAIGDPRRAIIASEVFGTPVSMRE